MTFTHIATNTTPADGRAQGTLRNCVEHIEYLREEKAALAGIIRKVYAEAQLSGFDAKAVRQIVRIRELPAHERQDYEDMLTTFMRAHGMPQRLIDEALAVSRSTV